MKTNLTTNRTQSHLHCLKLTRVLDQEIQILRAAIDKRSQLGEEQLMGNELELPFLHQKSNKTFSVHICVKIENGIMKKERVRNAERMNGMN